MNPLPQSKVFLVILAAGQGTRLGPLTSNNPKCLVKLRNKSILEHSLAEWKKVAEIEPLVVSGYLSDKIQGLTKVKNDEFNNSNMVYSLLCAREKIERSSHSYIYVSYGDIVCSAKNIKKLLMSDSDLSVVIDLNWKSFWQLRMENILDDVESLRITGGYISEIGQPIKNLKQVEGQYIGIIKFKKEIILKELANYQHEILSSSDVRKTAKIKNMYMTDFLQSLIKKNISLKPVFIKGGWIEVDTETDLNVYEKTLNQTGSINGLIL